MESISRISVCVLLPFYLIVLYDVPTSSKIAEIYNIKKTYPMAMPQKHKNSNQTPAIGRERCCREYILLLNFLLCYKAITSAILGNG